VLAGNAETAVRGSVLLAAYSAGLGIAFVLASIAFVRAMSTFRWLRDQYQLIRVVSGAALVILGLALFFHRDAWIRVGLNRALELVGLGTF
jgi:cytochrome c-type biogenesis protein